MDEKLLETLKIDAGFFLGLLNKGISLYDDQEEETFRMVRLFGSLEYIRMILKEFDYWTYESEFQEIKTKLTELGIIKEDYL